MRLFHIVTMRYQEPALFMPNNFHKSRWGFNRNLIEAQVSKRKSTYGNRK